MEKMPEVVRSRLARRTLENSAHPDANLLAAFAEHTLLEPERTAVVAHLMDCADCRECVAFVAAEPEAILIAQRSARARFRGWFHEWRWIASAAGACCLVAVTLQYYGAAPVRVPPVKVYSAAELQTVSKLPPQSLAPSVSRPLAHMRKVEALPGSKKEAPVLVVAEKEVAPEDIATEAAPPAVATAPPVQPAEDVLALSRLPTPKADAVSSFVEPQQRDGLEKQARSASSAKRFAAQPGPGAVVASGFTIKPGLKVMERTKLVVESAAQPARVLWSINASAGGAGKSRGVVERSADAGQSWQVVPLSERVSFRSVANSGPDVWAGGSEGTLFHSPDDGAHWAEIKVASENATLSDDIVRIDLWGPTQVTITTASGESWTSEDGKHWTRE